jgi:hypothetical protein
MQLAWLPTASAEWNLRVLKTGKASLYHSGHSYALTPLHTGLCLFRFRAASSDASKYLAVTCTPTTRLIFICVLSMYQIKLSMLLSVNREYPPHSLFEPSTIIILQLLLCGKGYIWPKTCPSPRHKGPCRTALCNMSSPICCVPGLDRLARLLMVCLELRHARWWH